jgi:hypothetical protein
MKRENGNIVIILFPVLTALVFLWSILLLAVGVTVLEMFHVAAPSSAAYQTMLRDACADSKKLLYMAVIPLAMMNLLWLFAFLSERRKNKHLSR